MGTKIIILGLILWGATVLAQSPPLPPGATKQTVLRSPKDAEQHRLALIAPVPTSVRLFWKESAPVYRYAVLSGTDLSKFKQWPVITNLTTTATGVLTHFDQHREFAVRWTNTVYDTVGYVK